MMLQIRMLQPCLFKMRNTGNFQKAHFSQVIKVQAKWLRQQMREKHKEKKKSMHNNDEENST